MTMLFKFSGILLFLSLLFGCRTGNESSLPKLGRFTIESTGDTSYYQVPVFSHLNQDSVEIGSSFFEDRFYVADFFFTSCPSICPKVKQQMLRIDNELEEEDLLHFMSFSIDYLTDSIPILKTYTEKIGVAADRWQFVQLDRDYEKIANEYLSIAYEDAEAPGGFDHSGRLILIDDNRHIRAICDGTDPADVDDFIEDIKRLSQEYNSRLID